MIVLRFAINIDNNKSLDSNLIYRGFEQKMFFREIVRKQNSHESSYDHFVFNIFYRHFIKSQFNTILFLFMAYLTKLFPCNIKILRYNIVVSTL